MSEFNKIAADIREHIKTSGPLESVSNVMLGSPYSKPDHKSDNALQNSEMMSRLFGGLVGGGLGAYLTHDALGAKGSIPAALLMGLLGSRGLGFAMDRQQRFNNSMADRARADKVHSDDFMGSVLSDNSEIKDQVLGASYANMLASPNDVGIQAMTNKVVNPVRSLTLRLNNALGGLIPR
jgi:predicted lipid-binding transport protein (Tim44 family)